MPTEPLHSIIYRELSTADAKAAIDLAHQLLEELVNYGSNAIVRCASSSDSAPNVDVAGISLYRHILELTDAIDVLISNACVIPTMPLVRSCFECLIQLEYILSGNQYVERSLAWIVHFYNDRLQTYGMLDATTKEGQAFLQSLQSEGLQNMPLPTQETIQNQISKVNQLLSDPQFSKINQDFQKINNKRKAWYWLNNGPQSIRQLAYAIGRNATYDQMYGYWSRFSHALDFSRSLLKSSTEGKGAIAPIRNTEELRTAVNFTVVSMLEATRLMLEKFRKGEDHFRDWYAGEVRPLWLNFFPKDHTPKY